MRHPRIALSGLTLAAALFAPGAAREAAACGCFAPPDPVSPVVQAGERIVFAVDGNEIEAHIQIQFAGQAGDFGWLLPLPSIPTLEVGSDELFAKLVANTGPTYVAERRYPKDGCNFDDQAPSPGGGFGSADLGAFVGDGGAGAGSPVVAEGAVGPYAYAVLKADDGKEMFDWLAANRYFVPAGTMDVVDQYLHRGAYFLALKLRPGRSAGDLQPVIVRYPSDLPMIPIVLTSVTAQPDMHIQVWVLGDARAIPRNFYHVVLNDAAIDWTGGFSPQPGGFPNPGFNPEPGPYAGNYYPTLVRAMKEAPRHHAFATEYAGPSKVMRGALAPPGRFGDAAALAKITSAADYLRYLRAKDYPLPGLLTAILEKAFGPVPQAVLDAFPNTSPLNFFYNFDWYATGPGSFRLNGALAGWAPAFDPAALTADIQARVVTPIREIDRLFLRHAYLTLLHGALSPEDMTRDPVFSFNPFLPDVGRAHRAPLDLSCKKTPQWYAPYDGVMTTEQGWQMAYPNGVYPSPAPAMPAALRIEILREAGLPEVVTDNTAAISAALGVRPRPPGVDGGVGGGEDPLSPREPSLGKACSVEPGVGSPDSRPAVALALLAGAVALMLVRRRR